MYAPCTTSDATRGAHAPRFIGRSATQSVVLEQRHCSVESGAKQTPVPSVSSAQHDSALGHEPLALQFGRHATLPNASLTQREPIAHVPVGFAALHGPDTGPLSMRMMPPLSCGITPASLPTHEHVPNPLPSERQTCAPLLPSGQRHAAVVPGVQSRAGAVEHASVPNAAKITSTRRMRLLPAPPQRHAENHARGNTYREQVLQARAAEKPACVPRAREPDPNLDPVAERLLARARGSLAGNLRERRARAGKTQEAIAEQVGVSAIYVQALERGTDENPTLRVLALLAHALDCTVAELVAARPAPKPAPVGRPRAARAPAQGAAAERGATRSNTRGRAR